MYTVTSKHTHKHTEMLVSKHANTKQTNNIKNKIPLWSQSTASTDRLFDIQVGRYMFRVESDHCNETMMELTLRTIKISSWITENRILKGENSMHSGWEKTVVIQSCFQGSRCDVHGF